MCPTECAHENLFACCCRPATAGRRFHGLRRRLLAAFLAGRSASTLRAYRGDTMDFARFTACQTPEAAVQLLLSLAAGRANEVALAYRTHLHERPGRGDDQPPAGLPAVAGQAGPDAGTGDLVPRGRGPRQPALPRYPRPRSQGLPPAARAACRPDRPESRTRPGDCAAAVRPRPAANRGLPTRPRGPGLGIGNDCCFGQGPDGQGKTDAARADQGGPGSLGHSSRSGAGGAVLLDGTRSEGESNERQQRAPHRLRPRRSRGPAARPHGLRHAAITEALDATGGDVRAVQRFSRHRSLATLQLYDDSRQDLGGQVAHKVAAAG